MRLQVLGATLFEHRLSAMFLRITVSKYEFSLQTSRDLNSLRRFLMLHHNTTRLRIFLLLIGLISIDIPGGMTSW